ncbi:MAG: MFS transporter [Myxococcaceae bacterium]
MSMLPPWLAQLVPILMLLAVVALVLARLPKVALGHSDAFRRRRFFNWFPLGLTYAFLYFGRYNINAATTALGKLTPNAAFGTIFGVGAAVYGCSFLINGPLTDRIGGRKTILISAIGSAVMNALLGGLVYAVLSLKFDPPGGLVLWMSVLYGANMYFQSFGAVSIVKVNAHWFHLKERGVLGGVFGILISLGVYFGYDWSARVAKAADPWWVFLAPAMILAVFFVVDLFLIRDSPSKAGFEDFDVADASSGDLGPPPSVLEVAKRMLRNKVLLIIIGIEFCTGYLRNGVMSWYPKYANSVGIGEAFVAKNWGMLLCVAGIMGGMFAGIISDRVFGSRRGPVSAVLYAGMAAGIVGMIVLLGNPALGLVLVFLSLCYIGVHGMLSGTASADFGGKKNAGVAVGIIDGFVYFGTGLQSLLVGQLLPVGEAAKTPANWLSWPLAMLPVVVVGLVLASLIWNATAKAHAAPAVAVAAPAPQTSRTGTSG